jgi:hypothetical protein
MTTLNKWFAIAIVVIIVAEGLANFFLFPYLPSEWQARFNYLTIVIIFVLGLVLSLTVLWEMVKYVLSKPPKKS